MQPSQILPATTDKFKSVTGLTAGLNYFATVRILHGFLCLLLSIFNSDSF